MTWDDLDWTRLDRLRALFLGGDAARGPYWRDAADLAHYDFTFAARIGWKWDAVCAELTLRRWSPPPGPLTILDWGCGSGIAARRVLTWLGVERVGSLHCWDHSPLARRFAADRAAAAFPRFHTLAAEPESIPTLAPDLLIVSHVWNELDASGRDQLRALVRRSRAVLWVEPGTREVARAVQAEREGFLDTHRVVAPCTHQCPCGLLAPDRERDWCHHFAPPPRGIQADSQWVRFGQRAGIDLRSLPYAFLALHHRDLTSPAADPTLSRTIGRPEFFKPYARMLDCSASGIATLTLPKRTAAPLYKALERSPGPHVHRWTRDGDTITGETPLAPKPPEVSTNSD